MYYKQRSNDKIVRVEYARIHLNVFHSSVFINYTNSVKGIKQKITESIKK